jgi:hypothetical protein
VRRISHACGSITRAVIQDFVTLGPERGYELQRREPKLGGFMLDLTGIMFSSIMMLIVIIRAVRADRQDPWFQTVKLQVKPVEARKQPWRRQT